MTDINENRKNEIIGVFTRASSLFDEEEPKFFTYFGQKLVDYSNLQNGEKILDIACGRGSSLFPAINKIGSEGNIIGIDLAEGMVKKTSIEIKERAFSNAEIILMDAESLDFDDNSFDCVLCGFGIFFFPDLNKALKEIFRVLKLGGKFCASTGLNLEDNKKKDKWLDNLFKKYTPPEEEKDKKDVKDHDNIKNIDFSTENGMKDIFENAGFTNVKTVPEIKKFYYRNEESWYNKLWSHGGRNLMEKIPLDLIEEFKRESFINLQKDKSDKGILDTIGAIYSIGNKAN